MEISGTQGPSKDEGSIVFVGNATTVIRKDGFTILTDPNFIHAGDHAHLGYGLKTKRLTDPAIEIDQLPPLDLCVLSHMHGDHWDHIATEKLRKDLPIITTGGAVGYLKKKGFTRLYSLNTWDEIKINKGDRWLKITSMPGKHAPGILSIALPQVMGSMLEWGTGESKPDFRLYITGDTLIINDLKEIPKRFPEIDLALLHLGGTMILGLVMVTMDAKQGIEMVHIIRPANFIPIHYNDYEAFKSPLEEFIKRVKDEGMESRVHYLKHGDTFSFDNIKK
mgnify:FL=1